MWSGKWIDTSLIYSTKGPFNSSFMLFLWSVLIFAGDFKVVFRDKIPVIFLPLKIKESPLLKRLPVFFFFFFISRSKHVQYASLSPRGANSPRLSFDTIKSILYEPRRLCIPSWPLFLPSPNSRHYPPSFSKPLVWAAAWPLPSPACPCSSCLSDARSQFGSFSCAVIHLQK